MSAIECITSTVFASPMLALLLATCFKLDILVAQPQRQMMRSQLMPQVDKNGFPVCLDPDGRSHG
jgi:hypothetical protein